MPDNTSGMASYGGGGGGKGNHGDCLIRANFTSVLDFILTH